MNYYDIFVRHAFGNLRDILREVTYNAEMGGFLNARGNRAKDRTGREPNENYAREADRRSMCPTRRSISGPTSVGGW